MDDSPNFTADSYIPVFARKKFKNGKTRDLRRSYPTMRRRENRTTSFASGCDDLANIPWKKTDIYSLGVVGLHEEINDFYEVMKPTEQETELRLKVVEHITKVVHSQWPLAQVEVFGSFRTGLYLPSSDIDIVVIGEWKSLPLSTLSRALVKSGINSTDINIIANATVPIVRLIHSPSSIKADISFNAPNGVKGAKLIKKLIKEHPSLPKLVFVLKQFLIQRGLNEVYNGGMSSYCLTLLVVSLLQGYHKPKSEPSTNLGTLLIEFFEHYGINFNYEKVSIHFQNGGKYQPRFRMGRFLSVEDPLVEGNDIAKGTYLMHLLKMSFQNAYSVLSRAVLAQSNRPHRTYLGQILKVEDDVLRKRQSMSLNYSDIMMKLSGLLGCLNESSEPGCSSSSFLHTITDGEKEQTSRKQR